MNKKITPNQVLDSFATVKAAEEIDINLAIAMVSNPEVDGKELSSVLNAHLTKSIVSKKIGEPMQLDKKVVAAGIRNRFLQIIQEQENKDNF